MKRKRHKVGHHKPDTARKIRFQILPRMKRHIAREIDAGHAPTREILQ